MFRNAYNMLIFANASSANSSWGRRATRPGTPLSPELLEREKDFELADRIKRISPVSWKHVNFYGEYSPVIH